MNLTVAQTERVHKICDHIRGCHWVGIDEARAFCKKCPEFEEDPDYGKMTRGCFMLALECYDIALKPPVPLGHAAEIRETFRGIMERSAPPQRPEHE